MIDPPPLIGPTAPLRRVERTSRDGDPGRRSGGQQGTDQHPQEEHEAEHEDGEGLHVDVRA